MASDTITVRYSPAKDEALLSFEVGIPSNSNFTVGDLVKILVDSAHPNLAAAAKHGNIVLVHRGVTLNENESLHSYKIFGGATIYVFGKPSERPTKTQSGATEGNALLRELIGTFHPMFIHPAFHAELDAAVRDPLVIETALSAAFPDCIPANRDVFAEPILRNVHIYYVLLALRNSPNVLRTLSARRGWLLRGLLSVGLAVRERVSKRSRDEAPVSGAPFGFGAMDYEEAAEQQQQRVAAAQRPGDAGARIRRHPQFFRPYENAGPPTPGLLSRHESPSARVQASPRGPGSISSDLLSAALSRAHAVGGLPTGFPPLNEPTPQAATYSPAPAPVQSTPPPPTMLRGVRASRAQPQSISADFLATAMQRAQQATLSAPDAQPQERPLQQRDVTPTSDTPANVVTERELYASQINMLVDMGISEDAAIEALRACSGDLDAVMQFLFGESDSRLHR